MDPIARASLYTFGLPELQALFPEVNFPYEPFEEIPDFAKRLQTDLESRNIELIPGDLVRLTIYDDHPDGLYSPQDNVGKYIFDGEDLLDMTDEDFAEILAPFEVMTGFPVRYWEGKLQADAVYYKFRSHTDYIHPSQVQQEGPFFYYPVTHHGITYRIISDYDPSNGNEQLTAAGFLRELKQTEIFGIEPQKAVLPAALQPSDTNLYLLMENMAWFDNSPEWTEEDGDLEFEDNGDDEDDE